MREQLQGDPPYHLYHPRIFDHPGPVVVIGCLNWDPYCHAMRDRGKRLIGVDPQTTVDLPGVELMRYAVAPFRGEAVLYGTDGGASLQWFHAPVVRRVPLVTMDDVLDRAGQDLAGLQCNAEGAEAWIILGMKRPWADQMTIAFHDRPGLDPYIPTVRDALIQHLSQWYDALQLTSIEDNDWWIFLRRQKAEG